MKKKTFMAVALLLCSVFLFSACGDGSNPILTLEKVRTLSEKGEHLSWDDFEGYSFEEMGSGLYIRQYRMQDHYQLLMGGPSLEKVPEYIYLIKESGERIDVRYDSIDEFLMEN